MVKLYLQDCCRVEGLAVKVGHRENSVNYRIDTDDVLEHYDFYKKNVNQQAPESSTLDWSMNVLSPQGLDVDCVEFNVDDKHAELHINTINEPKRRASIIEVRAVTKDIEKTLWFVGAGNVKVSLNEPRKTAGNAFYQVYSDLGTELAANSKSAVFEISCEAEENDVVKVNLRNDLVGGIVNEKGVPNSRLNNDLQVLATAMAFQPVFYELLLKGNAEQYSRIESWLELSRPSSVEIFRELKRKLEGDEPIERPILGNVLQFSHKLAAFALEDFPVRSKTRIGELRSATYRKWLDKNLEPLKGELLT